MGGMGGGEVTQGFSVAKSLEDGVGLQHLQQRRLMRKSGCNVRGLGL